MIAAVSAVCPATALAAFPAPLTGGPVWEPKTHKNGPFCHDALLRVSVGRGCVVSEKKASQRFPGDLP